MTGYQNRVERRDLILATVTAVIGGAATVLAAVGILLLTGGRLSAGSCARRSPAGGRR